jgi:serine/threonine-protein kinase
MIELGTRLGTYEIVGALGAGGMGEVYRARDTKLKREVAIKVLPGGPAHDPERVARFEREAEFLAALNHPHIAAIYGFEDFDGTSAIVLELVEGQTLADKLAGNLPVPEALAIARQIADALETAHEKGVVHRDLKPANIKITPEGQVKVLDFGLAKMLESGARAEARAYMGGDALSHSPTLTLQATHAGVILGTAAYMSPEQARGKPVDKRADIWAFGVVLLEMLTGRPLFTGETVTDILAAVVTRDPDLGGLPAGTSPGIRDLLRRCLVKDPRQRLRDIGEARIALDEAIAAPAAAAPAAASPSSRTLRPVAIAALGLVLGVALAALAAWLMRGPARRVQTMRFVVSPPSDRPLTMQGSDRDVAIALDGTRIVYRTTGDNIQTMLMIRSLNEFEAVPLTAATFARSPFFSPDGAWVGFFAQTSIRKVSAAGGPAVTLCAVPGNARGASWGDDGRIVFATTDAATGLAIVDAGGGEPTVLTKPDPARNEADHLYPSWLPGGRAVLFTITPPNPSQALADNAQIAVLDLTTNTTKILIRGGSHAIYAPTGHLVYSAAGTLRAVRFDSSTLEVQSDPLPVVEQVRGMPSGAAQFAISQTGTLVYISGTGTVGGVQRPLVWVNRQGQREALKVPVRAFVDPRLSPDGKQVIAEVTDEGDDIWTLDVTRGVLSKTTFDENEDETPVWSPDGRWMAYSSSRGTADRFIYRRRADQSGGEEALWTGRPHTHVDDWTPDGRMLLVSAADSLGGPTDIFMLQTEGDRTLKPLLQTRFRERGAKVSPNGRWMAYCSDEGGRDEVYVRPFPSLEGRVQVSTAGGCQPLWSRKGDELFYRGQGALMAVRVQPGESFAPGPPQKLFDDQFFTKSTSHVGFDVTADGRFLFAARESQTVGDAPIGINVVVNWFEELKARVPAR